MIARHWLPNVCTEITCLIFGYLDAVFNHFVVGHMHPGIASVDVDQDSSWHLSQLLGDTFAPSCIGHVGKSADSGHIRESKAECIPDMVHLEYGHFELFIINLRSIS